MFYVREKPTLVSRRLAVLWQDNVQSVMKIEISLDLLGGFRAMDTIVYATILISR